MSNVLTVDLRDRPTGIVSKERAHAEGILHRAFSVFIHDGKGNMLLQRRAEEKYHSGGLWTNACCSHPLTGGTITAQARERMRFELGIDCPLREAFTYTYFKRFSPTLTEYEFDHVLIGRVEREGLEPVFEPGEVMDHKWISFGELASDVVKNPDSYSVWFIGTVGRVIEEIEKNG